MTYTAPRLASNLNSVDLFKDVGGKTSSGFGIGDAGSFLNPSDESRASATRMAGLFGSILGGGKKQQFQFAGQRLADAINKQKDDEDKKAMPSIQAMGDDMFLYTPTREPDFAEYEGSYSKGAGGKIGGALIGGLKGFAAGGPIGAVIGAGAGANAGAIPPPGKPPACPSLGSVVPVPSDARSESSPAAGRFRFFVCARAADGAGDGSDDLGASSSPHES